MGEQAEWAWGLPGVFRALAAPDAWCAIPQVPDREKPMEHVLGYWLPLVYLLVNRLGWSDPGRGLRAWLDVGRPSDDPTLSFVEQVWGRDGQLLKAVHWLSASRWTFGPRGELQTGGAPPSAQWLQAVAAAQRAAGPHSFDMNPEPGDGLHIAHHLQQKLDPDPLAAAVVIDSKAMRAIASFDLADRWYAELARVGGALPSHPTRNWHVDVYVKSIGWMGEFRLSRDTGRWFTGKHSVHRWGAGAA